MLGRVSRSGRPSNICAGDSLQPGSGVLRYTSKARTIPSLSRLPFGLMLSISKRFAVLTANSALPFEDGNDTEDNLCRIPHFSKNVLVSPALNSGPPSLEISAGTPNVIMILLSALQSPWEPASFVPTLICCTSSQPDNLSAATK